MEQRLQPRSGLLAPTRARDSGSSPGFRAFRVGYSGCFASVAPLVLSLRKQWEDCVACWTCVLHAIHALINLPRGTHTSSNNYSVYDPYNRVSLISFTAALQIPTQRQSYLAHFVPGINSCRHLHCHTSHTFALR